MMRRLVLQSVMALLPVLLCAQGQKPVTPESLQADAEHAKAVAEATNGEACAEICMDAAKKLAELSNQNFTDGKVDAAQSTMKEAGKYAEKAGRASISSHKRQKQTEIGLRRLSKRMQDIVKTLNFEDRPPVEQIIKAVEGVRSDLLLAEFDNPKKSFDQPEQKKKDQ
jgi:hypothetical protein